MNYCVLSKYLISHKLKYEYEEISYLGSNKKSAQIEFKQLPIIYKSVCKNLVKRDGYFAAFIYNRLLNTY